jgi:3-dehydroquinate synthase
MKNPLPHPVFSGADCWNELQAFLETKRPKVSKIFILCDTNTAQHCLPILLENCPWIVDPEVIEVASGEANKSPELMIQLWETMMAYEADRQSLLLNLGGGIVTDMGGFLAATFLRGLPFIQIPTSLLGMADAAIGGKTGLNVGLAKNMVGSFTWPSALVVDPVFLETLPNEEFLSGTAEMLKHGWVLDRNHFLGVQELLAGTHANPGALIVQSIRIKAAVVESDFTESGFRMVLNAGHTIGHALESHAYHTGKPLPHGFAVVAGLLCEAYIAHEYFGLHDRDLQVLQEIVLQYYPPIDFESSEIDAILKWMHKDKKRNIKEWRVPLPQKIGNAELQIIADEALFKYALIRYLKLFKP